MNTSSLAIIVLAAGRGTRMGGNLPKVILKTLEAPLIHHVLGYSASLNPDITVVVTGYGRDQVEAVIEEGRAAELYSFRELKTALQETLQGTGDAVRSALPCLAGFVGTVVILYGDVPLLTTATLNELLKTHHTKSNTITILTFTPNDPTPYGRIVRSQSGANVGDVLKIVEARDCSPDERLINEVNSGVYAVESAFLAPAINGLTNNNAQGEYYLTDIIAKAVEEGQRVGAVKGLNSSEFVGVNALPELALVNNILLQRRRITLLASGVRLEDQDSFFVGSEVTIAPGALIGPNVILKGRTTIESGVTIEGSAYLVDTTVAAGATIKFGVRAEKALIGANSSVGPFAHLRPGTDLGASVKIGNFVETKNAQLHEKVSASHLTYLGDCEVGPGTNIGAGTITCNYDGVNKYRTIIGKDVFIGSNSSLVAPVQIGDQVTIGAGSVIQRDVPEGALALTRAPLTVRTSYERKKKV